MTKDKLTKFNTDYLNKKTNSFLLVSIENIISNYRFLKKKANNTEIGVSIKADAYGLGFQKIFSTLLKEGCKTFFVATPEEAIETIKTNKKINLFLLNGVSDKKSALNLIRKGIKIVVNNNHQLENLVSIAKEKKIKPSCALHIDTGMNRLGIDFEEIENVILLARKYLNVVLIMSHLSSSEEKISEVNDIQLKKFKKIQYKFKNFKNLKYSLANSNGIFLKKKFHFSLCRPGGLVFGLNLANQRIKNIKNVIKLIAKVLQIKFIEKGEHVGYSAGFKAKKKMLIATLGIGYADGLPRAFSGPVYYKNFKFPIIGKISMDLCTIDISNYKNLKVNDWVEIFGGINSIEKFANNCDTITYEISSKIGSRVKRVYI